MNEDGPIRLSAVIITLNAAKTLNACLESVRFADEIVVVDSGSEDTTLDIARRFNARIINEPWRGFGAQKNFAVSQASHDWVLCIDADEQVSEQLRQSIGMELKQPQQRFRGAGCATAQGIRIGTHGSRSSPHQAAADRPVRAYQHTYRLRTITTNCPNDDGPHQFPEKPLAIGPVSILCPMNKEHGSNSQAIRRWLTKANLITFIPIGGARRISQKSIRARNRLNFTRMQRCTRRYLSTLENRQAVTLVRAMVFGKEMRCPALTTAEVFF